MSRVIHTGQGPALMRTYKDSDSVLDYVVIWDPWLVDNETIVSSVWISDGVFTIDSESGPGPLPKTDYLQTCKVFLSGGTLGKSGLVTNRIVTNQGRADDRSFLLRCETQ